MGTKRQRQQKAAKQRHKARRTQRQAQRKQRNQRARASLGSASSWPVLEAWISQEWHAWEATVHGVLVRGHADGTLAWCAFEVDLGDDGLLSADHAVGVQEGHVYAQLEARSAEGNPLVSTEPELIAKLAREGLAFRRGQGLSEPSGVPDALRLLGDLDPGESAYDLHFGHEDEHEPTETPRRGLLGWLFGA